MAFTETYKEASRWQHFTFFLVAGENGAISDSIAPAGALWRLTELRIVLDSAFLSTESLTIKTSSARNSYHNWIWISESMSDFTHLALYSYYSGKDDLLFQSGDQLVVNWSMKSGAHNIGIEAIGWAVIN